MNLNELYNWLDANPLWTITILASFLITVALVEFIIKVLVSKKLANWYKDNITEPYYVVLGVCLILICALMVVQLASGAFTQ